MRIKLYYFLNTFMSTGEVEVNSSDIRAVDCLMTDRIFLTEMDVEVPDVPVPSKQEICAGMVASLEKQKVDLQAKTYIELTEIDDKINQLLCLESKS